MIETTAAQKAEQSLQTILKAVVVGAQEQGSVPVGEVGSTSFSAAGALEPPYDLEAMCVLFEHANSLRQNVDAYRKSAKAQEAGSSFHRRSRRCNNAAWRLGRRSSGPRG